MEHYLIQAMSNEMISYPLGSAANRSMYGIAAKRHLMQILQTLGQRL